MANLQLKNISEDLHRQLREVAAQERTTISDVVLRAIQYELARKGWVAAFRERAVTELGVSAAELLEEARAERGE